MRVLLVVLLSVSCLSIALPYGSGPASAAPAAGAVAVELFQFKPKTLTVVPGARVTWTNNDDVTHVVAAGAPDKPSTAFRGNLNGKGTTFTQTFATAGTYPYFCARHAQMRGEIVVR